MNTDEFLKLFYKPRFRYIHDVKGGAVNGTDQLDLSWNDKGYGTFFTINGFPQEGSAKRDRLLSLNCSVADIDLKGSYTHEKRDAIIQEMLMRAHEEGVPPPTLVVRTKNGAHLYWLYAEPIMLPSAEQIVQWSDVQNRIAQYFDSDRSMNDVTQLLRVPGAMHLKDPSEPFKVFVQSCRSDNRYTIAHLEEKFPAVLIPLRTSTATSAMDKLLHGVPIGEGKRHEALAQIAGLFLRGANTPEKVAMARHNLYLWDKKVVGSPENWDTRRREIDGVFDSILKLEIGSVEKNSVTESHLAMNIVRWGEIKAMQFPPDRWRIANLIPKAGNVTIGAITGEGKSWVGQHMAECISTGKSLFGHDGFKTTIGRVLYIDAENGPIEIQRRGLHLGLTDSENLLFTTIDLLNLNTDATEAELKSLIRTKNIDVVIVDTFRAVAGGIPEEKAEETRKFFNRYNGMKREGVCFIWLDHLRKPERLDGKVPKKEQLLGSQDKAAAIDVLLLMKKTGDEINVHQVKNRLGREMGPFIVEMVDGLWDDETPKTSLEYGGELTDEDPKVVKAQECILEYLQQEGPTTTPELLRMLREKDIGERNGGEALRALVDEKEITKNKDGKRNKYALAEGPRDDMDGRLLPQKTN